MPLVPGPGGGHNVFELRVFGLPPQLIYRTVRGGHQSGRVAGPARLLDGRDGFARHRLASADNLTDRVAITVAEVVEAALGRGEAEEMRLGQVEDVNVIADAGAVGRGIIGAVNFAVRLLAEGHLQNVRGERGRDLVSPLLVVGV